MKKFWEKHSKGIMIASAIGLCLTCDWEWTNVKSFITGAMVVMTAIVAKKT